MLNKNSIKTVKSPRINRQSAHLLFQKWKSESWRDLRKRANDRWMEALSGNGLVVASWKFWEWQEKWNLD